MQSRSVILVDLGLVVFLGWFIQKLVDKDFAGAGLRARRKWVTLAPAIATALLAFFMLFFGNDIVQWMTTYDDAGASGQLRAADLVGAPGARAGAARGLDLGRGPSAIRACSLRTRRARRARLRTLLQLKVSCPVA